MKSRPHTPWAAIANEMSITTCEGCDELSRATHLKGKVTKDGVFHWGWFDNIATSRGLYKFMVFAAYALNPEFRRQPKWFGLYNASRWAQREAEERFRVRLPWEYSEGNRYAVRQLASKAGVRLYREHPHIKWWASHVPVRARIGTRRGALDG